MQHGTTLGHFEILEPLGAGGMGEVYRATDTNLRREVALKLLPAELSSDPERLARLQREAHLLAALNHPNIAAIHSLEQHDETRFLVMELVEGETLAEHLERGALAVEPALEIARQIAEAVEVAHEAGIIHRDLKPANVKITPEFKVKVLDFGLAKAYGADGSPSAISTDLSHSPTLLAATQIGVILGTAAYMSPEQAKGRPVDKRTDIWAFGCLLYEMLTARSVFGAEDVSETLASVLKEEPDWSALPQLPAGTLALLERCLRKDAGRRLHDIADARIEIEDALAGPTALPGVEAHLAEIAPRWQQVAPWTALGMVVGTVAGIMAAGSVLRPEPPEAPRLVQTSIVVPTNQELGGLAISPDGSRIVYGATEGDERKLFSRPLDRRDATPIQGTDGGRKPFFSPDGESVAFFADGRLKTVRLDEGVGAVDLAPASDLRPAYLSGTWGPDDTILFLQTTNQPETPGLVRIPAGGGALETLTTVDPETHPSHQTPHVLPDGRAFLFVARAGGIPYGDIVLQSFSTGETQVLAQGLEPRYVSTGHILYRRSGTLYALPFDAERLEATSTISVPVKEAVRTFDVSETGTLIYTVTTSALQELVLVDLQGRPERLAGVPIGDYAGVRFSPDGGRLVTLFGPRSDPELHVNELETERHDLLFSSIEHEGEAWTPFVNAPEWSPDSSRIAVSATSEENGELGIEMFILPVDGGAAERLLSGPGSQAPKGWSPDGDRFWYVVAVASHWTLWELPLEPQGPPQKILDLPGASVGNLAASPDGHWLAYDTYNVEQQEVYVKRYGTPGAGRIVSVGGGTGPVWAPDGATLYYLRGTEMMSVAITTDPELDLGRPRALFDGVSPVSRTGQRRYDLSPDGDRFAVVRPVGESTTATQIYVVLNWFEELKRLVPTGQ